MRSAVLALLLSSQGVHATPVPDAKEAERVEKLFGTPVDPDKDCKFKLDGNKLTITVPNTTHAIPHAGESAANAPRTVREVTGDFRVGVRVNCQLPRLPPRGITPVPYYAAGLLIYTDDRNYASLEPTRSATGPKKMQHRIAAGDHPWTIFWGGLKAYDPQESNWLEITRRGKTCTFAASIDGKIWDTQPDLGNDLVKAGEPAWGATVKVGVVAEQMGGAAFTATFEDFSVEPLAAAKK